MTSTTKEGETKEVYTYDAEGNRLSKTELKAVKSVDETTGEVATTWEEIDKTYYVMDTSGSYSQVIAELDASKNIKVLYTRGDGIISREEVGEDGTTSRNFYLSDGHGDVRQLTDETGEVTDSYRYNSYGELEETQGETENPYLYIGEYFDEGTGLYYLRARYMNPETGTFTSMDTYRGNAYDPASLHRYTYAQNNPQMYNDPSGHMIGLIGSAVSTAMSSVIRNRHAIHVQGMISGFMNSIINHFLGGENKDTFAVAFIKGYLAGAGMAAAYTAAAALGVLSRLNTLMNILSFGQSIFEGLKEIIIALAYVATGNNQQALMHLSTAVVLIVSACMDLKTNADISATGPKGEVPFTILNNGNVSAVGACFVEGTLIKTIKGYKEIENIKSGDLVYAKNTKTGETGWKEVVRVFSRESLEIVHLQIGAEIIDTTLEHPFWVEGYGFKPAGQIEEGDYVQGANGEVLQVINVQIEYLKVPIRVYNFEVKDWHTYYVSEENILVHNSCQRPKPTESSNAIGSKLAEVLGLVDNYNLSDERYTEHILKLHGSNSSFSNKSHFSANFDIKAGIDSTLTGNNFVVGPNTNGRAGYIFKQTFDNPIGTNSKGKDLFTIKVVVNEFGDVITSFPIK